MKMLSIAYYMIKRNFRDKRSISLTLLFPILLILILGTALSKVYEPDSLDKRNVVYFNADAGEAGRQFDKFLQLGDIKKLLDVKTVDSYEKGKSLVNMKKTDAFIYIPNDYSKLAFLGKKAKVKIYQSSDNIVTESILENVVDSFNNSANTMQALYSIGVKNAKIGETSIIKDLPITEHGNVPRAIDYYAVTMLAMTLMYGTLFASFGMNEDKAENTMIRIKSSPTPNYVSYMGRTLGIAATLMIQALLIIGFTKYAYNVNWGSNLPLIILVCAIFSAFATGLGIFAYALTNNAMRAGLILNIITILFTFVSGGYAKVAKTGSAFDKATFFVPNKMFQTSVFNTIYNGPSSETQAAIIGIVIMTVVLYIAATLLGRRNME